MTTARDLVAAAEATLTGRLVDRYDYGQGAPGWVWLNTLAHADWATLAALGDGARCGRPSAWDGRCMFLAGELVSTAGPADGLVALQCAQLVPLELHLLAVSSPTPSTPGELVSLVRPQLALARCRQAHPPTGCLHRTPASGTTLAASPVTGRRLASCHRRRDRRSRSVAGHPLSSRMNEDVRALPA